MKLDLARRLRLARSALCVSATLALFFGGATGRGVAAVLDTLHCNARVVVRDKSAKPIAGASVAVIAVGASDAPVGSEQFATSDEEGIAEFAALPLARYKVFLHGISARREVSGWSPPPGHPPEVAVGFDPWRHPEEVQEFSVQRTWNVRHGNCSDSLVVRIHPARWTPVIGKGTVRTYRNYVQGEVVILVSESETGKPVAFGNMTVLGERIGGMTGVDGSTAIHLGAGQKRLKLQAIGRLPKEVTVKVRVGRTATIRVRMERNPVQAEQP